MPEVALVTSSRQQDRLRELIATLDHELRLQAVPSTVSVTGFPDARPSLVYILLDPRRYVEIEGEQALPAEAILRRTIFLCAEPPPSAAEEDHIALLRRAAAVFVLDQRSAVSLQRLGIRARLMRPGYSTYLDHFDPGAERPIDVAFLGEHSLRRTEHLNRAARVLARHNCLLRITDDPASVGDTDPSSAEDRWSLLTQTKVLISLLRHERSRFDWDGALGAIHAGAVVVTEHSSGIPPLVPGEHLVVASADSLPFVAEDLLGDEQRLARLRSEAYERLRRWIPYALGVAVLRAAIVELVGEPVRAGASLGDSPRRPKPPASPLEAVPTQDVRELEPSQPATGIEVAYESPAWAARRASRITVIIAARGSGDQLGATLDSLTHSTLRDYELVVVGGGQSNQVAQIIENWISKHPRIAARLVTADLSGPGAARNVGVDLARGAFLLILDPGQELYPRCLEVLGQTLEAISELSFVYPIQEVTGRAAEFVQAGGDYLLNLYGWDPGRMRRGNGIHPPALIRTDHLRQLGGYTTDPRLDGFEEYDLWCRMAESGRRGQLVPQALARRSESGSSRTLPTIHPSPGDATRALMERAPTLMSGAFGVG